jgi:hypothetical protein
MAARARIFPGEGPLESRWRGETMKTQTNFAILPYRESRDGRREHTMMSHSTHSEYPAFGAAAGVRDHSAPLDVPRCLALLACLAFAPTACSTAADPAGEIDDSVSGAGDGDLGSGGAEGVPRAGGTGGAPESAAPDRGPGSTAAIEQIRCFCGKLEIPPRIPNILILADGSQSMFQRVAPGSAQSVWEAIRPHMLTLVMSLQDRVNFGLGFFTGLPHDLDPSLDMCPVFSSVPMVLGNFQNVLAQYREGPLADRKLEGPASQVFPLLPSLFAVASGTGADIVLFVTTGEPDFCDDGTTTCPVDATVAAIRQLAMQGISTYVIGQQSATNVDACPDALQAFGNAGIGIEVATPCPGRNFHAECVGHPEWRALAQQYGRPPGQPLVDYAPFSGGAKVYSLSAADQAALFTQIEGMVPLKSCLVDVSTVLPPNPRIGGCASGYDFPEDFSDMEVFVDGTRIPRDVLNGWRVAGDTDIELVGSACALWQRPLATKMEFTFECIIE